MSAVAKRLEEVYQRAKILPFNKHSKMILMSDCHRGQGNTGDNFLANQTLFFGALDYYYQHGFIYIELGDGDELWENRKIRPIIETHSETFLLMSQFYKEKRLYMLYGNHDIVKRRKSFPDRHCNNFYCDCAKCITPLFPGINMHEGLILDNTEDKHRLFLVHGHQGSYLNDLFWPFARFLVRYVWRPLELIGFIAPTGAGRPHAKKEKIEQKIASFANDSRRIVIAGHTHRPVFPSPGKGLYFNDGSCVHPHAITGIEIENNALTLVKWAVRTKMDGTMYVGRQILEGPVPIADFYTT